jgi:hypothetical protein
MPQKNGNNYTAVQTLWKYIDIGRTEKVQYLTVYAHSGTQVAMECCTVTDLAKCADFNVII